MPALAPNADDIGAKAGLDSAQVLNATLADAMDLTTTVGTPHQTMRGL